MANPDHLLKWGPYTSIKVVEAKVENVSYIFRIDLLGDNGKSTFYPPNKRKNMHLLRSTYGLMF